MSKTDVLVWNGSKRGVFSHLLGVLGRRFVDKLFVLDRFGRACTKRHSFLNFLYVCPEPVLAKWCILYTNGAKSGVFRTAERSHREDFVAADLQDDPQLINNGAKHDHQTNSRN
jgi:hypothetical protein